MQKQEFGEWEKDCIRWWDKLLTGKNQHWCPDWDFLPIDDNCWEYTCCTCLKGD